MNSRRGGGQGRRDFGGLAFRRSHPAEKAHTLHAEGEGEKNDAPRTSSSLRCLYMRSSPQRPLAVTTSLFFTASSQAKIAQALGSASSFIFSQVCGRGEGGVRERGLGGRPCARKRARRGHRGGGGGRAQQQAEPQPSTADHSQAPNKWNAAAAMGLSACSQIKGCKLQTPCGR